MQRYLIIFKGKVQGVGFRYTALRYAYELGLTGYAKNLDNGSVEVAVQGDDLKINEFIHRLLNEKSFIRVEDYSLKKTNPKDEKDFKILY